jgi:hypothetical protein
MTRGRGRSAGRFVAICAIYRQESVNEHVIDLPQSFSTKMPRHTSIYGKRIDGGKAVERRIRKIIETKLMPSERELVSFSHRCDEIIVDGTGHRANCLPCGH